MRYVEEFRRPGPVRDVLDEIRGITTRSWRIMEICGGQTHAFLRYGLQPLLPDQITLLHGPGCPVCVTPAGKIGMALALASRPGVIFCSFGDMLRVPGRKGDLMSVRSEGGDVRMVYSPLDAVRIARENPDREVVFFAIGFETTAPATAAAVQQAERTGLTNFSLLVAHVRVPPAVEILLSSPQTGIDGFLAAGHVCTVMGTEEYVPIAQKFGVPIVVTGFEPLDLLQGLHACILQLEQGRHEVENRYARSVRPEGNRPARDAMRAVFRVVDREWRGIGVIPESGLDLNEAYREFDAERKFELRDEVVEESRICIGGEILQGLKKPDACPAFGTDCTPETPLGATMVSSEGACAAYWRYRRNHDGN
ncbi:MAG TPA: hydrogenase formation protein HypD [bacterium]|nr:hydrogenase formation protein HypD [bacterium]